MLPDNLILEYSAREIEYIIYSVQLKDLCPLELN